MISHRHEHDAVRMRAWQHRADACLSAADADMMQCARRIILGRGSIVQMPL